METCRLCSGWGHTPKSLVFGKMLDVASLPEIHKGDLFHDVLLLNEILPGDMEANTSVTWYYMVKDTGTHLFATEKAVSALHGRAPIWRFTLRAVGYESAPERVLCHELDYEIVEVQ